jgi:hypothetical protein
MIITPTLKKEEEIHLPSIHSIPKLQNEEPIQNEKKKRSK